MAKKSKFNKKSIGPRITNSLVGAGVGMVASVAERAIGEGAVFNYGALGIGIVLPIVVKGNIAATAGDSLVAIGGYNLGKSFNLAGMVGLSGLADRAMIGNQSTAPMRDRLFSNKHFAQAKSGGKRRNRVIPSSENMIS